MLHDMDLVAARAQILDDLGRPRSFYGMWCSLHPFAIPPHISPMAVMDPNDRRPRLPRGLDYGQLRRHEGLVTGKDHLPAGLAEFVDHINRHNGRALGIEPHSFSVHMRREDIDAHG